MMNSHWILSGHTYVSARKLYKKAKHTFQVKSIPTPTPPPRNLAIYETITENAAKPDKPQTNIMWCKECLNWFQVIRFNMPIPVATRSKV